MFLFTSRDKSDFKGDMCEYVGGWGGGGDSLENISVQIEVQPVCKNTTAWKSVTALVMPSNQHSLF